MPKPKDIKELREQLLDAFELVKQDPRRANQVKEMTNTAGKIISTVKTELEYAALRGEEPEIAFLGKTSGRALRPGSKSIEGPIVELKSMGPQCSPGVVTSNERIHLLSDSKTSPEIQNGQK